MSVQSQGGGRPVLDPGYLMQHRVGVPGQRDVIWNPLFDANAVPSAGTTLLTFYANQQGQGTSSAPGVGAVAKTIYDTNMTVNNQLTLGNEFYAIGSESLFFPGVNNNASTPFGILPGRGSIASANTGSFVNDVWEVGNQGIKVLKVGTDRVYINDGPLNLFPPTTRLAIAAALAQIGPVTTSLGNEISYAAWSGEPYTLVPIYLQTNQQFTVQYVFPVAIALPSQQIGRMFDRLRGYLIRQAT